MGEILPPSAQQDKRFAVAVESKPSKYFPVSGEESAALDFVKSQDRQSIVVQDLA